MPVSCAAYGCTSRFNKTLDPSLTFHRFPKDEALRQIWVRATRRKDFSPTKYSRLCSKHFREDEIDRTSLSCVRLRTGAVPFVLEAFPKHLQRSSATKRKPPKERVVAEVHSQTNEATEGSFLKNCKHETMATELLTCENDTLKRKLQYVQGQLVASEDQNTARVKKAFHEKSTYLEKVISELKSKSLISNESLRE